MQLEHLVIHAGWLRIIFVALFVWALIVKAVVLLVAWL